MILAEENLITIEDLPAEVVDLAGMEDISQRTEAVRRLDSIERAHIIEVLKEEHGNKARAARTLGIHRRKLYRLLERFEIDESSYSK